jgi:hypothetical protein
VIILVRSRTAPLQKNEQICLLLFLPSLLHLMLALPHLAHASMPPQAHAHPIPTTACRHLSTPDEGLGVKLLARWRRRALESSSRVRRSTQGDEGLGVDAAGRGCDEDYERWSAWSGSSAVQPQRSRAICRDATSGGGLVLFR